MQILDTTIRDGSNALAQSYGEADITTIVEGLARSGIGYIEVGNGVSAGLDGGHGLRGQLPDATVLALARRAAPDARIGLLAVPALIATQALAPLYDDIDFVRLSLAPHEFHLCGAFAADAQRHGKQVFVQLVKSHLLPIDTLVEAVQTLVDQGVDGVYVVDTVGGMTPDQVRRYVAPLRDAFSILIGFHGHNNCSYAVANALAAIESGADMIDATIGGIGRGGGNLQMELIVALLQRDGHCPDLDLNRLFELSAHLWSAFPNVARGIDPFEVCFAINGLDSLSLPEVLRVAREQGIGPFELIGALHDCVTGFLATPQDVLAAADKFRLGQPLTLTAA
jgi:4-hydroxy-2-oxovalerate aldolase